MKVNRIFISVMLLAMATKVYAGGDSIRVVFQLSRVLATGESGVGLNGTFNNWGNVSYSSTNGIGFIPLKNVGNNLWRVTVPLAAGVYSYKFITYSIQASGDTLISSWITDPGNPKTDGSGYNNSIINVKDPMLYYVSPMNGKTIGNASAPISALVSWADNSTIDPSSLSIVVDNVPVANAVQYLDTTNRIIKFIPPSPFTFASHTVMITISNSSGKSDTAITNFKVTNQVVVAPYTFYFDPSSPGFKLVGKLNSVSVKGQFNNYGSDPLSGPDSDGVYSITENLNIGVPYPYQYIINGGQYIDDPDNPVMDNEFQTLAIKRVNPRPVFNLIWPRQGQVFNDGSTISIKANLIVSDSNYAIDRGSLNVFLDNVPVPISTIDSVANGVSLQTNNFTLTAGRHEIRLTGSDVKGNTASTIFTIGAFPPNSGFHYVDADSDDNGPGNYKYPPFTPVSSADIKEIDITSNATNDSLIFNVVMGAISDYTRMSFEIVNSVGDSLILDPNNAAVQIPAFDGRGVYFIVAPPNSSALAGTENQIYNSTDIYSHALSNINVNQDAKTTGIFKFAIPLNLLESVMGSFSHGWYFIAFSYLGNTNGAWKVTNQYGGSFFPEQPNIYDAAFFFNNRIEKRNLSNFNYSFNYGGSRYVKLSSNYRGALLITPGDISSGLAGKPYVRILTNGGEIRWGDSVRVFVAVSDSNVHSGLLSNGSTNYSLTFVNDTASVNVALNEGENQLVAFVQYGSGQTSYSSKVYFNCIKDHKPNIMISKTISGGTVTLDATATTNPDGLPQTFVWSEDRTNPQPVALSSASAPIVSFSSPLAKGEYFFTLTCTTPKDSSYQRVALIVDSTGAHFPDISNWHAAWIDSAIIYEVYVKTYTLDGNFRALTNRIQQIKNLGVNTIWLMPVYPSPQLSPSNPGYVITNYFDINPAYGTLTDFKNFVDSAHANGIRVMMDYVVNHTHNTHPFMLDAIKFGNASPYRGFYSWNPDGTYQYMFTWYDLPSINYDGSDSLRNMNYLINMAKWWMLNYNIDGFRCDVAWGVNDTRKNGPEFWRRWRLALKTIKPDAFLLGELDAAQYKPPQSYFDRKFDGGYDYSTINALRNALSNNVLIKQLDSAEAYYASPDYPQYAIPMKYIENHDEPRFISQYSVAQTQAAATIELTLPGVPLIYAGQEVGEPAQRGLIDWADPNNLRQFYQKIISIRHQFKAFDTGRYVNLRTSSPDTVFAFARVADTLSAVVASNLTNGTTTFHFFIDSTLFSLEDGKEYFLNDLLSGNVYAVDRHSIGSFGMTLAPYQTAVMILADTGFVTGVKRNESIPAEYALLQNYPNPFNPTTNIQFLIGNHELVHVVLDVFNILGQKVRTLVDDYRPQGTYRVTWDGKNDAGLPVASGVYFYVLKANNFVSTKKMILLK